MSDWFCVIQGQRHGPRPLSDLQDWAKQGILKPADLVWTEGMAGWVPAGTVQGQFVFVAASPAMPPSPAYPTPTTAYPRPHRGVTILVLGIVGLVCCFIPGIIAWAMAESDLRDMKEGRMDPAGYGLTQAGRICGIVSVVLAVVSIVISIVLAITGHLAPFYHFHSVHRWGY
jgi:hypothetical protein